MATHSNHGDRRSRKEQVQSLLSDAVASLCQKLLMYNSEMCIEGLLGITLDQKDIVLVNIREVIKEASSGGAPHKPQAADMPDPTYPRDHKSPLSDTMEVVSVTDDHENPTRQRSFESTRRRVSCEAPNVRPQPNYSVNPSVHLPLKEQGGREDGSRRRQGCSGSDWVSDIIHNTIGPGKDTDYEADNESPINLDASLYDDPNQSVNYTAMSVAMDTIRASDSGETRSCCPAVTADVSRINGEVATNRILLPEPIMQTEKQVSHCDNKCTSQQPVLMMSSMLKNDVRNVTNLAGDANTQVSHNVESSKSVPVGHTDVTSHNTSIMTSMGHTSVTGHNTNNMTSVSHTHVIDHDSDNMASVCHTNIGHNTGIMTSVSHTNTGHNADNMTSVCHTDIIGHSDKVKVKMEPLDNTGLPHLVGLTNLDPKIECAYTCHLCRRAFSHKRTLMRHQRTHHLGQKHFCPFCNKPFGRKDTMRRHSLMYHPMAACSQMSLHEHMPIHSSLQ